MLSGYVLQDKIFHSETSHIIIWEIAGIYNYSDVMPDTPFNESVILKHMKQESYLKVLPIWEYVSR